MSFSGHQFITTPPQYVCDALAINMLRERKTSKSIEKQRSLTYEKITKGNSTVLQRIDNAHFGWGATSQPTSN